MMLSGEPCAVISRAKSYVGIQCAMLHSWRLAVVVVLAACLGLASSTATGAKLAISRTGLVYFSKTFLPIILHTVETAKIPNPAASGDEHGIEYTIANVAISGLSASATPALHPTGAMISLAVSALQLNVNADVHLKEKSWPHAHLSAKITATSSSSSAAVGLSVSMDAANKAQILLNACSASISLKVKISHLGIFDKVADFIVKEFSGTIKKEISDAICKEAFPEALATANKALEAFSYFAPIPLPAPFKAEADVHLSAAPGVISSPNATYMGVSSRASFLTGDGHADPSTAPALPQLGPKDLGSHMVTVQVSAYPFQSAAWALYTQGALQAEIDSRDLPVGSPGFLNTSFYRFLLPELQKAYPNQAMALTVNATAVPSLSLQEAAVPIAAATDLIFSVILPDKSLAPAFTLGCNISSSISAAVNAGGNITGRVGDATLRLAAVASSFGRLGPMVLSLLQDPMELVVNRVILPRLNDILAVGASLPSIKVKATGYTLEIALTHPELGFGQGYALVGTDVNITTTPTTAAWLDVHG